MFLVAVCVCYQEIVELRNLLSRNGIYLKHMNRGGKYTLLHLMWNLSPKYREDPRAIQKKKISLCEKGLAEVYLLEFFFSVNNLKYFGVEALSISFLILFLQNKIRFHRTSAAALVPRCLQQLRKLGTEHHITVSAACLSISFVLPESWSTVLSRHVYVLLIQLFPWKIIFYKQF